MIRSRDDIDIQAFYRTRRETWRDLRLRVGPRGTLEPFHRRQQAQLAQQQARLASSQPRPQASRSEKEASPASRPSSYGNPFATPTSGEIMPMPSSSSDQGVGGAAWQRRRSSRGESLRQALITQEALESGGRRGSWSSQSAPSEQQQQQQQSNSAARTRVDLNRINSRLSQLREN